MAISRASFVQETTSTTGTGTYSLAGATTGRQAFIDGNTTGSTVRYSVTNSTDWEVCEGVLTAGTPDTLTRGTVLESSNSGSAVNWTAGNKTISQVFTPDEADNLLRTDNAGAKSVDGNPYLIQKALENGATITWTPANGTETFITINQNSTLALNAVPPAGTWLTLLVRQDTTGNRTLSYSATHFNFGDEGTPVLSTGASRYDILSFRSNGTRAQFVGIAQGLTA